MVASFLKLGLLLLCALSASAFSVLTTVTPSERRIRRIARLLGEDDLALASSSSSHENEVYEMGTEALTPPRTSKIVAYKTAAGTLVLKIPWGAASAEQKLYHLTFAGAWFAVVSSWTREALRSSSPAGAVFSMPFWVAGAQLVLSVLATTHVTLEIGQFTWQLTTSSPLRRRAVLSGDTRQNVLRADIETYYAAESEPTSALCLHVGKWDTYTLARGLTRAEERWLRDVINDSIHDLQQRPHDLLLHRPALSSLEGKKKKKPLHRDESAAAAAASEL